MGQMVVSTYFYKTSFLVIFSVYLEIHSTPYLLELSLVTGYVFISSVNFTNKLKVFYV